MDYEQMAFNDFMTKLANKINELKYDFDKLSPYNRERVKEVAQKEIYSMMLKGMFFPN